MKQTKHTKKIRGSPPGLRIIVVRASRLPKMLWLNQGRRDARTTNLAESQKRETFSHREPYF